MDEITRTEKFLRACIDGEPCALKPLTRVEKLLAELNDKLAGGSSEVVILTETAVTVTEGQGYITTPLSATPTEGATARVTYNGTEYLCPVVAQADEEVAGYMLGNLDATGNGGGNPYAPFLVMLFQDGFDVSEDGTPDMYGMVMPLDGATTVTLSIVQTEGASGGGASGDYIIVADATTLKTTQKWSELAAAVQSKRNVRLEFQSEMARMVLWPLMYGVSGAEGEFLFYTPGTMYNSPARYRVIPGEDDSIAIIKAGAD